MKVTIDLSTDRAYVDPLDAHEDGVDLGSAWVVNVAGSALSKFVFVCDGEGLEPQVFARIQDVQAHFLGAADAHVRPFRIVRRSRRRMSHTIVA